MRATRSYAFLVFIGLAILLSVGVTGYRTLYLQDFEKVDYPEEELSEASIEQSAQGESPISNDELATTTSDVSSTEPLPALTDEPDGTTPNPFD